MSFLPGWPLGSQVHRPPSPPRLRSSPPYLCSGCSWNAFPAGPSLSSTPLSPLSYQGQSWVTFQPSLTLSSPASALPVLEILSLSKVSTPFWPLRNERGQWVQGGRGSLWHHRGHPFKLSAQALNQSRDCCVTLGKSPPLCCLCAFSMEATGSSESPRSNVKVTASLPLS